MKESKPGNGAGRSLMTVKEAMEHLRVSRQTVRNMVRDGRLEATNLNPNGKRAVLRVYLP